MLIFAETEYYKITSILILMIEKHQIKKSVAMYN